MAQPETQYAQTADGVTIAFQTLGDGPVDVVLLRAMHTNLEHDWDERVLARVFHRVAEFGRLILFDRRGTGLSDPIGPETPTLDARMDDLTAVLDAVGSESAALVGLAVAATAFSCLYAATYPGRVSALVLYNPQVCGSWQPDYPWAPTAGEWEADLDSILDTWGRPESVARGLAIIAPSRVTDRTLVDWLAASERRSASPRVARVLAQMSASTDVRPILSAIKARTLVVHRGGNETPVAESAWISDHIDGAELVRLSGPDHMLISGDTDGAVDEIERYITGQIRTAPLLDRVLETILFTDIVTSTEQLALRGDRDWADLIARHHAIVRRLLRDYRGRELDTAGDGFFAVFDGPARAVRCAQYIVEEVHALGLQVRAGIHTGECEVVDGKVAGLAVVVAARVMGRAEPGQTLLTATVRDLTAGAGFEMNDAGLQELKGVPGRWQLYAVGQARRATAASA